MQPARSTEKLDLKKKNSYFGVTLAKMVKKGILGGLSYPQTPKIPLQTPSESILSNSPRQ